MGKTGGQGYLVGMYTTIRMYAHARLRGLCVKGRFFSWWAYMDGVGICRRK